MYRIVPLVLMAAFYGCYFFKMLLQKRKGIVTDQMGRGKIGFVRFVEVTLKTVTILIPLAELAAIAVSRPAGKVLFAAGAIVGACGVAAFIASVVTMKDNWRAGVPESDKTDLVVEGIYRWSRNPAFLGFDLVYLGIWMMVPGIGLGLISLLGALMLHLQIVNVEEDHLLESFGDSYLEYRRHVGRYFGRK